MCQDEIECSINSTNNFGGSAEGFHRIRDFTFTSKMCHSEIFHENCDVKGEIWDKDFSIILPFSESHICIHKWIEESPHLPSQEMEKYLSFIFSTQFFGSEEIQKYLPPFETNSILIFHTYIYGEGMAEHHLWIEIMPLNIKTT